MTPPVLCEVFEQPAGLVGISAARRKAAHPEDAHATVECDRHYIPASHRRSRRPDPDAIDADMSCRGECGSGLAGADHTGMPKPFVDSLTFRAYRPFRLV
jgi:hypothetical protein